MPHFFNQHSRSLLSNFTEQHQINQTHSIQSGFTIIESLIAAAILCITVSIAIPSFNSVMKKIELTTSALRLHTTLKHARNHALSQQVMVIVCQMNPSKPKECSPRRKRYDNWQNGWMSFADLNENNELDEDDEILFSYQNNSELAIVFNQLGRLRFFPRGSARSAGFYFCNANSEQTKYIRLLHTGRSRISSKLSPKQLSQCQNQIKN